MPALLVSTLFHWPCSISIQLSPTWFLYFPKQVTVRRSQYFLRLSALLPDSVSAFPPACHPSLSPFVRSCLLSCWSLCLLVPHCVRLVSILFPFVSLLVPLHFGHCVPLVSLLFPFVSLLVSLLVYLLLSLVVGHCVRLVSLLSPFVSTLVSLLVSHCVRRLFPFVSLLV